MHRVAALIAFVGLWLAACPAVAEDCRLHLETGVPMNWDQFGRPTVPFTVEGSDLDFVVDTGGISSGLSAAVARKLKLVPETAYGPFEVGFGGVGIDSFVIAQNASFGRLDAPHMHFVIMPDDSLIRSIDGLLAPQILGDYEVELDFAGAKVNLFNRRHCPGRLVYWTRDQPAEIPFHTDLSRHILVTVQLDGHDIDAGIDTGSADTIIDGDTVASLFQVDPKTIEGLSAEHRRYPFKHLSLGGLDVSDPSIQIVPRTVSRMPHFKMLIGANILRQLHLIISYREEKIYATEAAAGDLASRYSALSAGFDANLRGQHSDAIAAFSVALGGDVLPRNSLLAAHQGRASAELRTGHCQDALSDLDAILAADSIASYSHFLRGEALDCLGRQAEAGHEYSALIATGAEPGAYAFRGWLLWRSGDKRAAEQDFSKLAEEMPKIADVYLMLVMARARLGLEMPAMLGTAARELGSRWPGPILRLYYNWAKPEEVLAAASDPHQTCEADFYVGEWWLAQNDRVAARTLLNNAAALCDNDETMGRNARAELSFLDRGPRE